MRFLQSAGEFPCAVTLGDRGPVWGLSRWGVSGLRFVPADGEGFTLRGDTRRLVYKGRRRSHRFTILGDTAFEYDCILNREPESNTVTLVMDGAERFDFFKQPDCIKDPFLAGSYAVYKKETLTGEGTGKLCHIHRPLIIDGRGRRVWGDLSIKGNRLCITIPETWLSEAKYPVIVDPVIGTSTVGSQTHWVRDEGEDEEQLYFECAIPVNRFLVTEAINGTCTAYAYTDEDDYYAGGRPVLYSDNGNKPQTRRSAQEGSFDFRVTGSKPKGWRSASLSSGWSIAGGSCVWFGVFTDSWWFPRFDYGARCYTDWWWDYGMEDAVIPDEYPLYSANYYEDLKLSMYFEYTTAQNYTRTLTQGVTLTDGRKQNAGYRRTMHMNADGITLLGHASNYCREPVSAVNVSGTVSRFRGFFRAAAEHVTAGGCIASYRDFLRIIGNTVRSLTEGKRSLAARRDISTAVKTQDYTARQRGFIRTLLAGVTAGDYTEKIFTLLRTVREEAAVSGEAGHLGDYLRGLYTEAGSRAETGHAGEYHRRVQDAAGGTAVSLRHLFIFLRLATLSLVRDYITGRFLRSKEELVIKSLVCRELTLESTLH